MAELRQEGALGFTDDGRPVQSAGMLRKALQYQRLCGGVLALHEEDPTLSRGGAMHEGSVSAALGIAGIPTVAESTMVARDAALAGYEGARVHFQHLSCAASVEAVAAAKAHGWRVSAEVCPHHLLLTEEDVGGLDTRMKMHPPLTTDADREALIDGLRAGTLDCVATDHAPHAREEKEVPFEQAPMGSTGLETAFAALYTRLVLPGVLGLPLLVERMTAGGRPVRPARPDRRGRGPANLALVDLEASWIAGEHGWESRSENCCFAGESLRGPRAAHPRRRHPRPPTRLARAGGCLMGMLSRERAALLVVDVQEGFRPYDAFTGVAQALCEAARSRPHPRAPGTRQRAVPEGARPHRPGGRPAGRGPDREDRLLRRPRRGLRALADRPARATRRSSAGSRPTCA